jgi:hypothetical protein
MMGERLPKLKPNFIPLVHTAWVAPTDFGKAIKTQVKSDPNTFTFTPNKAHLRFIIPLLGVMAVVTAFQIWLSDWPTQFFSADSATLAIQMTHHSGYAIHDIATQADLETDLDHPTRITLEVDGELVLDETYEHQDDGINQGVRIFQQVQLPVGNHRITIKIYDRPDAASNKCCSTRRFRLRRDKRSPSISETCIFPIPLWVNRSIMKLPQA